MKFALSFVSVLAVIVGALLFIQFQVYSEQADTEQKQFRYSQEIEIVYRGESLDIRQHFNHLPESEVTIQWPKDAVNVSCFIESENSCNRLTEEQTVFKEGNTQNQSVSYVIPLKDGLTSRQLLTNVFAQLSDGEVQYSTVHISTDRSIKGQWVTGLPIVGTQQLALVNYSMFSGTGRVKDLFWQDGAFALQQQSDQLSIYSKTPLKNAFYEKLSNVNFINEDHIAVINGSNLTGIQGYRMLFIPNITVAKLKDQAVLSEIEAMYKLNDSPLWVKQLLATYLTGTPYGEEKVNGIISTLNNQMSESQKQQWLERIEQLKGEVITADVLDKEISKIFGATTHYFTMNDNSASTFPFLFNDSRKVYVDEKKQENIQVVLKDSQILYSAIPLLNTLGYEAKQGQNGFYVNSDKRVFRFPEQPGFYVFNQRRYDIVSEPIKLIAGEYFIEEAWLQRLFLVEVEKDEDTITIKKTN
jgi:hypothetical protein